LKGNGIIPYIPCPQNNLNKNSPPKKKKKKHHTKTHTSSQHESPNDKALYKQIENETLNH
jgi:hypothetical protein